MDQLESSKVLSSNQSTFTSKKQVNKQLTPEILRTFPGFELLSGEQATSICSTLNEFALICIEHLQKVENK